MLNFYTGYNIMVQRSVISQSKLLKIQIRYHEKKCTFLAMEICTFNTHY